jgi:predicted SnoaL-like aldol condensation-catalyzing enzyme
MEKELNKALIINYIENVWNKNKFDLLDEFISPDFIDYSLPSALPPNKDGLKMWITGTGRSFEHTTIIEEMVAEKDKVIIKIKMSMKHIGIWRDIEATGMTISTNGYRNFTLKNGKIKAHWALIDGTAIENQLKDAIHGCKVQV